jgi:hypothetical protein
MKTRVSSGDIAALRDQSSKPDQLRSTSIIWCAGYRRA